MSDGTDGAIEARIFEAHSLIDRRRFAQARQVVNQVLQSVPDDVEARYLAAYIEYAQNNSGPAMAGVDDVLALDPHHYGARSLRATLLADGDRLAAAEQQWIALLRDYPEDADSFAAYADLMLRAIEVDKARRLAVEGLRHAPDHERCLYVLALSDVILGRGSVPDGGSSLQRLLSQHPERARSSLALVTALSDRGDHAAALRVAQELLRAQPDSPQILSLVRSLRFNTHWSLLPLYPVMKWGWAGSFVMWAGVVGILMFAEELPPAWSWGLSVTWLAYVVYSWVWPRILGKFLG